MPHSVPTQSEEERAARQQPKPRDVVYDVSSCLCVTVYSEGLVTVKSVSDGLIGLSLDSRI